MTVDEARDDRVDVRLDHGRLCQRRMAPSLFVQLSGQPLCRADEALDIVRERPLMVRIEAPPGT